MNNTSTRPRSGISLAQSLYWASGLLIFSMSVLAVTVWTLLGSVAKDAQTVASLRTPQLQHIANIQLNVTRASLQLRHAILARNPSELSTALADVADKKKVLEAELAAFGTSMATPEGKEAFKSLPALMDAFWAAGAENVKLIQDGQKDEAFAFLVDRTVPARNRLLEPLSAEKVRQVERLQAEIGEVSSDALFARNLAVTVVLLVSAALAGLALFIVRVMHQLGAEPAELKRVADAVAAGDLSTPVHLTSGDTTSILAALKTMRDKLAATVRAVRQNAESVATASAQIATGNADLSGRTEQQASSLQQTASSMEQLGGTVRLNAENARQANQLAINSRLVAAEGGKTVLEVVETMKGINESSRRIADIIGTIDGIAFQTNILALNAAVEAARAGEQGRGFAVVASEVRSLAQRSAEAAREIKTLISASVERVEQGTQLVDLAGSTMQEIVASIQRVTDIVAEISAASTEQSAGVTTVGNAVTQMDRATQQNAALVEESAAAAESLKQQAQQLVQAVAVFRLA